MGECFPQHILGFKDDKTTKEKAMPKYRNQLPQLNGKLFLTDGGLETTLVFHEGVDLPHFAAFDLMREQNGKEMLRKYFEPYVRIARDNGMGFILESPTWRAHSDWGSLLDYSEEALGVVNLESIEMLDGIRTAYETELTPMPISGDIGPRGDGYFPDSIMTAEEAELYHSKQINTFANSEADMVTALTITNTPEAIGLTRAAKKAGIPMVISFTLETNGCLPTGQSIKDAILSTDAETGNGPVYYMVNCAHPSHFKSSLATDEEWVKRLRGLRANASTCSHAELDEAEELDEGDPFVLGKEIAQIRKQHGHINVLGGCCGTDHRHIEQISVECGGVT
jgi:S-methylmethionine-dependent homocysteine/selenocysteine methylase